LLLYLRVALFWFILFDVPPLHPTFPNLFARTFVVAGLPVASMCKPPWVDWFVSFGFQWVLPGGFSWYLSNVVLGCLLFVSVFLFIMSSDPTMPEYLHKDELQYELQFCRVSTEGLNVAALRSVFRTSRDLKENAESLTNSEKFKDPESILSFCRDRFNQIKDLVDNTDSSRINVDLPRYIHRLRHVATRLRHLFQFAKLGAEMQSTVIILREDLERFVEEIAGELRAAERIQPAPTHTVGMAPPSMVEGRPEPIIHVSAHDVADNLTHRNITTGASSHQNAQSLSIDQVRSTSRNDSISGFGAPFSLLSFPTLF
jgi:hypothetical protein